MAFFLNLNILFISSITSFNWVLSFIQEPRINLENDERFKLNEVLHTGYTDEQRTVRDFNIRRSSPQSVPCLNVIAKESTYVLVRHPFEKRSLKVGKLTVIKVRNVHELYTY